MVSFCSRLVSLRFALRCVRVLEFVHQRTFASRGTASRDRSHHIACMADVCTEETAAASTGRPKRDAAQRAERRSSKQSVDGGSATATIYGAGVLAYSCTRVHTRLLAYSLTHLLAYSRTRVLVYSLTRLLAYSLTRSLACLGSRWAGVV